uniref:Venom protein family 2 protein 3 n=1 Tax=Pristhesancus plagipennis TaxID=1955184 RepID=A0A1Q1NPC5_PRIPG|nr:venom protein family 2 protein 3 [Pristhesancus plagipennis]
MAVLWKLSALVAVLMALSAEIKSGPVEPQYNEVERMVLEDIRAQQQSRGMFDALERPKCWFEDFTAACCIKMKYRTGQKDKKGKDIYGKHRACVEAGIDFHALKAFVRSVYDGKILGKELAYKFGEFCWPLPEPLSQLNVCVWLWHVDISIKNKVAEACFLFSFTKLVHVKIDCLRWENGNFKLHNRILPKKDQAIFTLYMGVEGVKIEIKNNYLVKIWKTLQKVWEKITGLFGKSKDMAAWVKKTYPK